MSDEECATDLCAICKHQDCADRMAKEVQRIIFKDVFQRMSAELQLVTSWLGEHHGDADNEAETPGFTLIISDCHYFEEKTDG